MGVGARPGCPFLAWHSASWSQRPQDAGGPSVAPPACLCTHVLSNRGLKACFSAPCLCASQATYVGISLAVCRASVTVLGRQEDPSRPKLPPPPGRSLLSLSEISGGGRFLHGFLASEEPLECVRSISRLLHADLCFPKFSHLLCICHLSLSLENSDTHLNALNRRAGKKRERERLTLPFSVTACLLTILFVSLYSK